jgi:glyoxylase-like metal-dependent hydrolase (beta-lactamase superfamily II)
MRGFALLFLLFSFVVLGNNQDSLLKVNKLAENVYQHISYKNVEPWGLVGASGLIVIDGSDAHMIDTPWTVSETKELMKWARLRGFTIKTSVITHFHSDASTGISYLNRQGVETYATQTTNKLLVHEQREASINVISSKTFEVVKGIVEVFYPGAGHSQDNVVVWLPNEKILFGGCFVKSLQSNNLGNTVDASITEWPQSIQRVINKYPNIKTVVPGHGKVGDDRLLAHTSELAILMSKENTNN